MVGSQKDFSKVKLKEKEAQFVFQMEKIYNKSLHQILKLQIWEVMSNHRFKLGYKLKASGVQTCKAGYRKDLDYYKFDPA